MSAPLPVVEVMGPWLKNKGDVLNLWAVATRLDGKATTGVSSSLGLPELPPEPQLTQIRWTPSLRRIAGEAVRSPRSMMLSLRRALALQLLPRSFLHTRGFTRGSEVRALLDCSGYAYGDVWTTRRLEEREPYYRRLKEQGAVLVLLPQALGPFEDPSMREWSRRLLDLFDLIFARDEVSYGHASKLGVPPDRMRIVPDITHLLEGHPAEPELWRNRVCIVPNARMLDQTDPRIADAYLRFLVRSARAVLEHDLEPVLLIHEKNDHPVARQVVEAFGGTLPIIDADALVSKGILGACYMVVGSRYHAIVSAISQGTPVIGTSWSHKYEELFGQYGCEDLLASPGAEVDGQQIPSSLFDPERRDALARDLRERAAEQKRAVEEMWQTVESRLPFLQS